ncbi:MAG: hypothetical protein KatS3mg130_0892 [Candidatus Sumerlaea sp.]|nr:MAG: hypothetical protein KatS3mg130_0892 [Candidatus Sumerlaea sp.]
MTVSALTASEIALNLPDLTRPLDFQQMFQREAPVELEIGSGRGDFLISYAKLRRDVNLLGIERKLVIVRRAANKISRANIRNVRLVSGEVFYLLQHYFPPQSLHAIHCYFPDPWPKKRHAKRRLFQPGVLDAFARVLRPSASVFVRTDVASYFDVIRQLFREDSRYVPIDPDPALLQCLTGFERRFIQIGKPIYRVSYRFVVS